MNTYNFPLSLPTSKKIKCDIYQTLTRVPDSLVSLKNWDDGVVISSAKSQANDLWFSLCTKSFSTITAQINEAYDASMAEPID